MSGGAPLGAFGDWVKTERKAKGLTLKGLEAITGVSYGAISDWERGRRTPHRDTAVSVAQALGADPRGALEALMADTPGIEVEYVPNDDTDRSEYMAFFDNAPSDEARRRLKIIAEQVAAAWHNQQEIVDGKEQTRKS